ncbi:hypothetical protein C8J57DRAFT_1674431 [Mycena rebaudengoi]|nr:hypothetical protein C8J57DRAFT_1674431 [Mycena rebaudengoi]
MTITQNASDPLVVAVGVTGNQGGSVVKALAESDKPYHIRGLTRDVTKLAAREFAAQGVEMVSISLSADNADAVKKVFEGANVVFVACTNSLARQVVTNYWEHLDVKREVAEAKMLIDVAKAVGVGQFIWSGLESVIKVSNGKYSNVHFFNGKGEITEYGRNSGIPFINVQAGWYASNFYKLDAMKPKRLADGMYKLSLPVGPNTILPVIDTAHDYGLFVCEAIESPEFGPGSEILTSGEVISIGDMVSQLAKITGKKIVFASISDADFIKATGFPHSVVLEVLESMKYYEECGYYAGKDTAPSRRYLGRPTRTWAEWTNIRVKRERATRGLYIPVMYIALRPLKGGMNLKEIMHGGRLGLKNVGSVGMINEPCCGASIDRKALVVFHYRARIKPPINDSYWFGCGCFFCVPRCTLWEGLPLRFDARGGTIFLQLCSLRPSKRE